MKPMKFENRIKEDLYDYKSDEDALDIWSAIDSDVNALNRKNRRKDNKYILFFLLLIGASSLLYLSVRSGEHSRPETTEVIAAITEILDENSPTEIGTKKVNSKTKVEQNITVPEVLDVRKKGSTIVAEKQNADKITLERINKSQNVSTIINEKNKIAEIAAAKLEANEFNALDSNLEVENDRTEVNENQKIKLQEKATQHSFAHLDWGLSSLSLVELEALQTDKSFIAPALLSYENESVEIRTRNFNKFSLGINAGVLYASKKIEAKNSDELNFAQSRLNTEKTLETIHGSIYGAYKLNKRFSISTGIGYTRINEEFNFDEENIQSTMVQGQEFVVVGSGTNPTRFDLMGLVEEVETTTTSYTLYNKYELIDIPVFVSYMWSTSKWSYGVQAGIIANLNFKGSGRILESETRSTELNDTDIFKNALGMSYGLNLLLERRMNRSFDLVFTPSFRYFPSEFTNASSVLRQKYQLVGLDVGLKYNF